MANEKTEELKRITNSIKEHEEALESLYRKHVELTGDIWISRLSRDAERYDCHIKIGAHRIRLRPGNMKEAAELLAEVTRVNLTALCDCASGFQWTTDPEAQALEGCPPRDVWNDSRSRLLDALPVKLYRKSGDATAAASEESLARCVDLRHAFDALRAVVRSNLCLNEGMLAEKTFTGVVRAYMRHDTNQFQKWLLTEADVAAKNERSLPPDFAQVWHPYAQEPSLPDGYVTEGWKDDDAARLPALCKWPFKWRVVRKESVAVDSGASNPPSPEPSAVRYPKAQIGTTWPDGQTWTRPIDAARVVAGHVPNEQFLFDEYRAMARRLRAELDAERSLTEKLRAELDAERAKAAAVDPPKEQQCAACHCVAPNASFILDEYRALVKRLRAELDAKNATPEYGEDAAKRLVQETRLYEEMKARRAADEAKRAADAKPEDKK